ncbi:MAG: hypothetical protein R2939_18540 [Kofleriaceae bacterium]
MRFGPWYPLAEASTHAPAAPGLFQVRLAEGLRPYPRGKSAMVHYQVAVDVRAEAVAFAAAWPGAPWVCRHAIELAPDDDPAVHHARLLRLFVDRFGVAPSPPAAR